MESLVVPSTSQQFLVVPLGLPSQFLGLPSQFRSLPPRGGEHWRSSQQAPSRLLVRSQQAPSRLPVRSQQAPSNSLTHNPGRILVILSNFWIWFGFGLDFALSLAFTRILAHSSFSISSQSSLVGPRKSRKSSDFLGGPRKSSEVFGSLRNLYTKGLLRF